MRPLLEQIKKRRKVLAFKQHDMLLRVGMSRQQYQRLETRGNPRLDTLELVASGLNSELLLIPLEKLNTVLAVLADDATASTESGQSGDESGHELSTSFEDDPWQGLLGENE